MNSNKEFWYHLVQGTLDKQTGVFANFYCPGEHCGDSFSKAEKIAKEEGIISPVLIETCRLDNLEEFELPEDAIQVDEDSFMLPTFNTYELVEGEYEFIPPTGIAFGTDEGEYDTDLIKEAFVAYNKNDDGIFEFELVLDHSNLIPTYLKAIDFLPSVDGFWVYLLDHWDNSKTELWVGKNIVSKDKALKFLTDNEESTLKNGFLDIVVHSKEGETNLTLNQHKKVQLHTKNEAVFQNFIGKIEDLGFEQTRDYYNIEDGYYHWHYRPAGSFDKPEFKELLKRNEFEKIEN